MTSSLSSRAVGRFSELRALPSEIQPSASPLLPDIDKFDVKYKDYCINEFHSDEVDAASPDHEKEQVIALIQDVK